MRLSSFIRCRSMRATIVAIAIFFAATLLLNSRLNSRSYGLSAQGSTEIRQSIIDLSREYVRALAREQQDLTDHAYAGHTTYYDLKKTFAVLLESLLQRIEKLELALSGNNTSSVLESVSHRTVEKSNSEQRIPFNAAAIAGGAQEQCTLPHNWKVQFPACEDKIKWMESYWKSDPCYESLGVDGSYCSFVIYLSEIELQCPRFPWRPKRTVAATVADTKAAARFELEGLFLQMKDNPVNFQWIKGRITRMWPMWVDAYNNLAHKQNWTLSNRRRKTILMHLGFLTKESGFKFGEKSLKGGPLGELVQWSDLIASLYILGHDLIISSEINTFVTFAQADPALKSSCPVDGKRHVDVIYTDIVGLRQMKKKISASLQNYKCRLRVLDSFGTQAEFNHMPYFTKHKEEIGGNKRNVWGGHGLTLQQFYTMYPHSPDNTFLGFVVETLVSDAKASEQNLTRKPWALVYGKEAYMWKDSDDYINTVRQLVAVHGTVNTDKAQIPDYVVNHGVLSPVDLQTLLRQVKIFLGLGFPYEGPAPLEAIANGAIFINPRFKVPKSRQTEKFFAEKPTSRALHSQNPYAEDFIGEPYVLTIDIENRTAVSEAIRKALSTEVTPFLPYEFTSDGMLERVNAYVEHQDFCAEHRNWPPFSAQRVIVSAAGQSCKDACWAKSLICEPSYFAKNNNEEAFKQHFPDSHACASSIKVEELTAPGQAESTHDCLMQSEPLLYSCAAAAESRVRLCPCRDFIKDQAALCAACL